MPTNQITAGRKIAAFFATACLPFVASWVFACCAVQLGWLFSGLDADCTIGIAAIISLIAVRLVRPASKRTTRSLDWQILVVKILIAATAVFLLSIWQTRGHLKDFTNPASTPKSIKIHQGRTVLFTCLIHFTAQPADIIKIIQAKQLVEIPGKWPGGENMSGFTARDYTKNSWDWWQPMSMPHPKFFYRHHDDPVGAQGWSESWWVSGETNEVYAIIRG